MGLADRDYVRVQRAESTRAQTRPAALSREDEESLAAREETLAARKRFERRRRLRWVAAAFAAFAIVFLIAMAVAVAASHAAGTGSSSNYDGLATRAAAKADKAARISRPPAADPAVGSPDLRFAFTLAHNSGEVIIYRSHSDAKHGLAKAKVIAKAFGVSLEDYAFLVRNVVIDFAKTPTQAERNEAMSWLRSH